MVSARAIGGGGRGAGGNGAATGTTPTGSISFGAAGGTGFATGATITSSSLSTPAKKPVARTSEGFSLTTAGATALFKGAGGAGGVSSSLSLPAYAMKPIDAGITGATGLLGGAGTSTGAFVDSDDMGASSVSLSSLAKNPIEGNEDFTGASSSLSS